MGKRRVLWLTAALTAVLLTIMSPAIKAEDSQPQTQLRYRFVAGESHEYRFTYSARNISPIQSNVELVGRYSVKVLEVRPDGVAEISVTLHPVSFKYSDPAQNIEVVAGKTPVTKSAETTEAAESTESTETDEEPPEVTIDKVLSAIEGKVLVLTVTPLGYAGNVRGMEAILRAIASALELDEEFFVRVIMPLRGVTPQKEGSALGTFAVFPVQYPVQSVAVGGSWKGSSGAGIRPEPVSEWLLREHSESTCLIEQRPISTDLKSESTINPRSGGASTKTSVEAKSVGTGKATVNTSTGWVQQYQYEINLTGTRTTEQGDDEAKKDPVEARGMMLLEMIS